MKKALLEHIIRETVSELLNYIGEAEPTVGAAAPPAGGLGTADTPALEPPTAPPPSADIRGLHLIDPKNPAKTIRVDNLQYGGSEQRLNTGLYRLATRIAGPQSKVQVSLDAMRKAKEWFSNPASALFLYVGKDDPSDPEAGMMLYADKNIQNARAKSAKPEELTNAGSEINPSVHDQPFTATADDYASKMTSGGAASTQAPRADEVRKLREMIKDIISEQLKDAIK